MNCMAFESERQDQTNTFNQGKVPWLLSSYAESFVAKKGHGSSAKPGRMDGVLSLRGAGGATLGLRLTEL